MSTEKYYPCLIDDDTGEFSNRVGPAMSWPQAVDFLKQNYSGAWQNSRAAAKPVSHPCFTGQDTDGQ